MIILVGGGKRKREGDGPEVDGRMKGRGLYCIYWKVKDEYRTEQFGTVGCTRDRGDKSLEIPNQNVCHD